MIFYGIFKFLHWLYGWGEIDENTRRLLTALSGFEMVIVSLILIIFFFVEMPDIIKNWRKKMNTDRFKFRAWSIDEQKYYDEVQYAYSDDCKNCSGIPDHAGDEHFCFGTIVDDPGYIIE